MIVNLRLVSVKTIGIVLVILVIGAFSFTSNAQIVTGVVIEKGSNKPIAFASILAQGTTQRTNTDVNGKFDLPLKRFPAGLFISALGYSDTLIHVDSIKWAVII